MRCGCPECKAYMIQSEGAAKACVCPDCSYRCNACMGTNTLLSREELFRAGETLLARMEHAAAPDAEHETYDKQDRYDDILHNP